jgi:hypothetical protein
MRKRLSKTAPGAKPWPGRVSGCPEVAGVVGRDELSAADPGGGAVSSSGPFTTRPF